MLLRPISANSQGRLQTKISRAGGFQKLETALKNASRVLAEVHCVQFVLAAVKPSPCIL
jgi:hypothetical protein